MTDDPRFFPRDDRASSSEVAMLGLIAGVILAALATALGAMLMVCPDDALWTAFAIGTVFGVTSASSTMLIATRRS